jgi:TonB-dependent SusC/RagA subfamily outer membrane receptor
MKKLLITLFLLPLLAFANQKEATSKITKATVYLSGAQITRTTNVSLKRGTNEIWLKNLSPLIDENSIQIGGLQSASILSISYNTTHIFPEKIEEKIAALENKLKVLAQQSNTLDNLISGLKEEDKILSKNQLLWNETETISLTKVKEFTAYYRTRVTGIYNEIYTHTAKKEEISSEINKITKEIASLSSKNKDTKGEILLKLSSNQPQQVNLQLTYLVSNAGWFPVYDIKAINTASNLNIYQRAHVYQDTGENWNNVKITLSTADPSINPELPKMSPHYLNFASAHSYNQKNTVKSYNFKYNPFVKRVSGVITNNGEPLPGVNILIKGTNIGTQTDFDGKYTIDVPQGELLQFSYLGFKTEELPIYSSIINVQLEEDVQALDEVVVTAMGISRSGKSLGYSQKSYDPLYVIDGELSDLTTFNTLNEQEIANVTVLKGADATAIYGSRATSGVYIITTKEVLTTQNITNKEYVIKQPYSIPSALDITAIAIEDYTLPSDYEYFAAPVLNENVFLTAKLTQWEALNLLPGEANVYFAGTYAGKTYFNPITTKKEIVVSLGPDSNLTVSRKPINNYKGKTFVGSSRILTKAYDIAIKNNKSSSVVIKLMDRIPVSQNSSIKVYEATHEANTFNKEKGLLTWNVSLNAKENNIKTFSYKVKYPKNKRISL